MWNPASITDMMNDDLDITEAVILDHITAILMLVDDQQEKASMKKKLRPVSTISAHISNGGGLSNESSKPWHWLKLKRKYKPMKLRTTGPSREEDSLR